MKTLGLRLCVMGLALFLSSNCSTAQKSSVTGGEITFSKPLPDATLNGRIVHLMKIHSTYHYENGKEKEEQFLRVSFRNGSSYSSISLHSNTPFDPIVEKEEIIFSENRFTLGDADSVCVINNIQHVVRPHGAYAYSDRSPGEVIRFR